MKSVTVVISLAVVTLCLGWPPPAVAHRVDEYLQASRIGVDRDRVILEISLTAGISLAPLVFSWVDTNHNGRISAAEADAYAQQVLHSVELSVDGQPAPVTSVGKQFPDFHEMSLGVGTIRISASAPADVTHGQHRVFYRNTHHPEWSVYLANALAPKDDRIEIIDQDRDRAQRELAVDYQISPGASPARSSWSAVLFAVAGLLIVSLPATRRLGVNPRISSG